MPATSKEEIAAVLMQKHARGRSRGRREGHARVSPDERPDSQPHTPAKQDINRRQLRRREARADLRSFPTPAGLARADFSSWPVEETLLLGRVEEHVQQARRDVWAVAEGRKDIVQIGGMEAFATKINLASVSLDAKGIMGAAGYARFTETGRQMVDRAIQMSLNSITMSALIISIAFSVAFDEIVASDETIEYFGGSNASSTAVSALLALHDVCINLAISSNLLLLMMSFGIPIILLSWIPQLDAQVCWLIQNTETVMYVGVLLPFFLLFTVALAAVPASFLLSPVKGFVSLILPFTFAAGLLWAVRMQTYVRAMQFAQARHLFGMQSNDIPRWVFDDAILVKRRKAEFRCARVQRQYQVPKPSLEDTQVGGTLMKIYTRAGVRKTRVFFRGDR